MRPPFRLIHLHHRLPRTGICVRALTIHPRHPSGRPSPASNGDQFIPRLVRNPMITRAEEEDQLRVCLLLRTAPDFIGPGVGSDEVHFIASHMKRGVNAGGRFEKGGGSLCSGRREGEDVCEDERENGQGKQE